MDSDRDSTYGSVDREDVEIPQTGVVSPQTNDVDEMASEHDTQQSMNNRVRRNWRPPYVEIPEHDQNSTSRDAEDDNSAAGAPQSRAPSPPLYTAVDPLWGFRIPRRQREWHGCSCPISRECPHKPRLRKDCRVYAPHWDRYRRRKSAAHPGGYRWEVRDRPRKKNFRSILHDARFLERQVAKLWQADAIDHEEIFEKIRRFCQHIQEDNMDEEILEESNLLETIRDLSAAVDERNIELPIDVHEDLLYLYRKWLNADLSVDPNRGLISEMRNGRLSYRLDPDFKLGHPSDFYGSGHLVNGQGWPLRMCMVRDGAHRYHQAGICGRADGGAQAVVMGKPEFEEYADVDLGDEIWYVGTPAKENGEAEEEVELDAQVVLDNDDETPKGVTNATRLLFKSVKTQNEVRVFRSSKLPKINKLKPLQGFRYDGVYKVVDYELLEEERALYRFHMVRVPGQGPIRSPLFDDDDDGKA